MSTLRKLQHQALERCLELAAQRYEGNLAPRPALARLAGVSARAVYKWHRIPSEHCLALEEEFSGEVTRYQMRPDVFGEDPDRAAA